MLMDDLQEKTNTEKTSIVKYTCGMLTSADVFFPENLTELMQTEIQSEA